MVVRTEKHKPDLRQPLLAKLWWASMPVFIASQGLVAGEAPSSAAEHFWPIHESTQSSGHLKNILNHHTSALVAGQIDPLARKPSDVDGENDIEVDWFADAPSNQRFKITAEHARNCIDEQDCRFVPCDDSSNLCRTFLYQQETAKKVASVASHLCTGTCAQASPSSWESCHTAAASPWLRQYLTNECAAPAASELTNVPVFACDGCLNADSGASYHIIASSQRYEASDIEITRPAVSQLSYVPAYLDASGSYGFEVQTSGYGTSLHSVATETNESCPGCLEEPIPPLLVSSNVSTITGMTSGEFGDADKLHLQIVLADQSNAADFRIVDANRTDTVVRDIPYLLCDGCDVTHGHPTGENECVAGSCIILLTDSVHLTRQLEPFQSLPSIACADCQLVSLSGEHSLAQANNLYDWAYPASERVILGINRQEEESLLPLQLVYALEELTHLNEPLAEHTTILAHSYVEGRSGLWSSAPSPSNIFTDSDCIGAECEHKIAYLTPDHPTAARAAFPGTHYDTIEDIDHTNTFAGEQLSPTDPSVYCEKDTIGAVTVDIDAVGVLDSASRSFLAIARDRCSNVRNPQGIAQSAPDPKIWNKVEKLTPPTPHVPKQLVETIAGTKAQPTEAKKQQAPDFWSVLDNLVETRQPAYEMGTEVVSTAKTLAPAIMTLTFPGIEPEVVAKARVAEETTITFPGIEPEVVAKEFPGVTLHNDEVFAALLNTMRKDEINAPVSTDPYNLRTEQNSTLSPEVSTRSPVERFQGLVANGSGKPERTALIEKPNYAQILASATTDAFAVAQEPPATKPPATTRVATLSQKHTEMAPHVAMVKESFIAAAPLPKTAVLVQEPLMSAAPMPKAAVLAKEQLISAAPLPKTDVLVKEPLTATAPLPKTDILVKEPLTATAPLPKAAVLVKEQLISTAPLPKTDILVKEPLTATAPLPKTTVLAKEQFVAAAPLPKSDILVKEPLTATAPLPKTTVLAKEQLIAAAPLPKTASVVKESFIAASELPKEKAAAPALDASILTKLQQQALNQMPAPEVVSGLGGSQSFAIENAEAPSLGSNLSFIADKQPVQLEPAGLGTDSVVIANASDSKTLRATYEPKAPPARLIGQEQAEAMGLDTPGLSNQSTFIAAKTDFQTNPGQDIALEEREAADYIDDTTKALRLATQPLGDSAEPLCKPMSSQAGGQAVCYPVCSERTTYPQCNVVGETQKQCFDTTQIKQLTACVDPKGLESVNVKVARRPQEMWSASPGPGSQHVTAEGKVPGGLDIASGRTGVRKGANDEQPQVRELQGGYYYYIGEGPTSSLSTNKDHLQVSGRVTQLPGTSTDVAAENMRVNLHGKEQVGIREYVGRKGDGTLVALAPSIKGGDYRRETPQARVDTSVTLTSTEPEGISTAFGRADLRAGKSKYNFVKVVDVTKPSKARSQAGKVSRVSKNVVADAADKKHRFAVEVTPHSDSSPTMKSLVGPAKQPQQKTTQRRDSLFIDFAHAGDLQDSIGYEPNSFVSVGAPIYDDNDDYEGYDDEPTGVFVIGSYDDQGNFIEYDEDEDVVAYEDLPIGEPGIDPLSRKHSVLGVRREGLLWDGDKPWLDEEETSEIVWDDPTQDDHFEEMQPPDKARKNSPSRVHPTTSGEVAENTKREPEVTLQKKNRTTAIGSGSESEQEPSYAAESSSSNVSNSQVGQPDDEAYEADEESGDTALDEWEKFRSAPGLAPSIKRDLDPRRGLDKTIAQETLFESGVPEPQKQKPAEEKQKQKEKPVIVIEEEEEPQGLLINYRDILMTEYVKFVSQLTNKNFVFNDEDLQFKITVISEQPTSVDNIMAALLQELRIHGLQVIEQGNNIIIHKSDRTRGPVQVVKEGDKAIPHSQLVTRVFQLDSIQAEKMQEIVTPVMSAQALIQVLPETNNLLITDFTDNVDRIADLIHALDMPTTAYEIGQYVGHNNFIENLIPLAEEIIRPFAEKQNIVFVPHLATNSVFVVSSPLLVKRTIGIFEHLDALEGTTKILTLEDLTKGGQALVNPEDKSSDQYQTKEQTEQEKAEEIRARLEREASGERQGGPVDLLPTGQKEVTLPQIIPVPEMTQEEFLAQTKFYIHKLQYRQGDQLQDALTRIGDSLRLSEKASIDLINAINSIQWIESSNSLIVTGTPDALARVRELIEEVDLPLRQVFLEMLILDTSITDSLTYAVDITSNFKGQQVGAAQGFSGGQPSASGAATPLIGAVDLASASSTTDGATSATEALINAATLAAVSTPGYNLGIIGRRILKGGQFFNTMGALVQAVHTDINSEIVLNPKIIVEDNNEAEIFVGENIAFQTQNVVNNDGTIVSQNFEFRDVGTTLRVRPQIGNNNIITLEIEQEVSSTITTQTGGGGGGTGSANISPGPSTATSRTITKVHVPNEFFVVISGMIKEEKKKTRSQIPCLGGLPIIGAAGSRMENTSAKRNLMIFIRPQIVDTEWDFDDITKTQQNIYRDKGRAKPRWKYEADEGLEFMNLPRINERCESNGWLPGYRDDQAPTSCFK
ncbi:MAG: secretin N-terminal domain-containing protein [Chlamydiales bacterium]|nr:secretin N-terminal domain-containing protein [Chlamydiales bacterium]